MLNPQATLVMQPKDWIPVIGWFVVFTVTARKDDAPAAY